MLVRLVTARPFHSPTWQCSKAFGIATLRQVLPMKASIQEHPQKARLSRRQYPHMPCKRPKLGMCFVAILRCHPCRKTLGILVAQVGANTGPGF